MSYVTYPFGYPHPAELDRLTSQARDYIQSAQSEATTRAYRSDWRHFDDWCRTDGLSFSPGQTGDRRILSE